MKQDKQMEDVISHPIILFCQVQLTFIVSLAVDLSPIIRICSDLGPINSMP